jgi:DNA ligase (NAD+)
VVAKSYFAAQNIIHMRYSQEAIRRIFETTKKYLNNQGSKEPEYKMADLREVLIFHEYRYYVQNDPLISDPEYDKLYKELQELELQFPQWITPESPTQRVSSDLTEDFPSVPHLRPMLSLENSYDEQDLLDFDKQIRKLTGKSPQEIIEYSVEPKYDGGTIVLLYENDILIRAATRGDGVMGEEITNNARAIRSIPVKAAFSESGLSRVELRGEAIIRKSKFHEINNLREAEGNTLFANPRNTATGALRVKETREITNRGLEAFIYQISSAEDQNQQENITRIFSKHYETLDYLDKLGFKVPGYERKICQNIQDALSFCKEWEAKRDTYDYEIDGMVIKVNDLKLQEICGSTSHHPRWAVAFKFKAKQATSKLEQVEYQVGKTGAITPVAKITPVSLAGVTVSSVSLHNQDFIQSKDIRLGDTVLVERAGDVIPYIVKPLEDLRDGTEHSIDFPTYCPSCKSELVRQEGEAAWRCINSLCPAQALQRMIHHVSKDGMDIDGFGKSYIEKFASLGWLNDISDIYRLDYNLIAQLEGFGEKSALNLKEAIDYAKNNPIQKLLQSLSIHHLGRKAAKLIAAEVNYVPDLANWKEEDFTKIKEIGPVLARNVIAFFSLPENREMLSKMQTYGVNMYQTDEDRPIRTSTDAPLSGKTILFTGTLQKMGRKEAQQLAELAGAKNISAVSTNLDILVVGENAGSKLQKAKALETVTIWTEDEFLINTGKT